MNYTQRLPALSECILFRAQPSGECCKPNKIITKGYSNQFKPEKWKLLDRYLGCRQSKKPQSGKYSTATKKQKTGNYLALVSASILFPSHWLLELLHGNDHLQPASLCFLYSELTPKRQDFSQLPIAHFFLTMVLKCTSFLVPPLPDPCKDLQLGLPLPSCKVFT